MDIKQIRMFLAVCEHKSITLAAKHLYVSQQALSHTIGSLENDLGIRLFQRSRNGIVITEAGEYFYNLIVPVIEGYDEALSIFEQRYNNTRGDLRLALAPGILRSIGPDLLLRFQETYPDIRVHETEFYDSECPKQVLSGVAEIALAPETQESAETYFLTLKTEPLFAIVRRAHPLAVRDSVSLQELRDEQFVSLDERHSIYQNTIRACNKLGFVPDIRQMSKDVGFLLSLIREQDYLFICVGHVLKELAGDYVAVPLEEPEMVWRIGAIFKNDDKPSSLVKSFFNFVKNAIGMD